MYPRPSISNLSGTRNAQSQTPYPYGDGKSINLAVTKTFSRDIDIGRLNAEVVKQCSITMSPVMVIAYKTKSGIPKKAVLKVFDRRFGKSFRKIPAPYECYAPHTSEKENSWSNYIRRGKAQALFEEIKADYEQTQTLPCCPAEYWMDEDDPDRFARFEGALQYDALRHFKNETTAYERLVEVQGQCIPKLLAHVRISLGSDETKTAGINTDNSKFFEINGILMEQIEGFSLDKLLSNPTLLDEGKWKNVLQRVVDTAKDINERGVVLGDCRPGNVLIRASSETPFFHDFAQATIFDPKYRKQLFEAAVQNNNPGNLVKRLVSYLETRKKAKLGIKFPEMDQVMNLNTKKVQKPLG